MSGGGVGERRRPAERVGDPGHLQRIAGPLLAEGADLAQRIGDAHEAILGVVGQRHAEPVRVADLGQEDAALAGRRRVGQRIDLHPALGQAPFVANRVHRCAHESGALVRSYLGSSAYASSLVDRAPRFTVHPPRRLTDSVGRVFEPITYTA